MLYGALMLLLAACVYLPSLWVRWVMRRHSTEIEDMPGTGGELAAHLLQQFDMNDHKVEETTPNADHYDPSAKTVRLSPDNFSGKSLTAIAVAAHEVGHALQHHRAGAAKKRTSKDIAAGKQALRRRAKELGIVVRTEPVMATATKKKRSPVG